MTDQERIVELETAIRKHRDQRGDDRCWLDDRQLYHAVIEPNGRENLPDLVLPPKCEFLESCSRYWEHRQSKGDKMFSADALPNGMTIAQLEARVQHLEAALLRLAADEWNDLEPIYQAVAQQALDHKPEAKP